MLDRLVAARLDAPLFGLGSALTDGVVNACYPIEQLVGAAAVAEQLVGPMRRAFPDAVERCDICLSGAFAGGRWTASFGSFTGLFRAPLFGIEPTGLMAELRYGRFDRWDGGRIGEMILILDLPALMLATGQWPLAAPMGPMIVPAPATRDGIVDGSDAGAAGQSLALVEAMIAGLMRYDGRTLASMGMVDFWHPDFCWYGPGPIGSFQGHGDYERGHQRPFLTAFPDRVGGDHRCRIAAGTYVASTGWPSIRATHAGGDWLGLAGTGKRISMRVMDFWRRDGALLRENWVLIDIPDLLRQLGVDVFERARQRRPAGGD